MASHLTLCRRRFEQPLAWLLKWPNWLSLDAPLIALTWHSLIAGSLTPQGASVGGPPRGCGAAGAVLFLTVWLIYAGDRLLDVRRLDFAAEMAERHRFAGRWAAVLWPLWWTLLAVDVMVAIVGLEAAIWAPGAALFAAVVLYALVVHGPWRWRVPKELIVGTVFAVGTCLPVIVRPGAAPRLGTIVVLAGLFVLNCLCVAAAQQRADGRQQLPSAIRMFPGLIRWLYPAAIALAVSSLMLVVRMLVPAAVGISVAISACGLAVVGRGIVHAESDATRWRWSYWADPVLLSPLLVNAWMDG
ncbi:hypothetical protein [Roseimaritima ulvae]|uniref:Prenyltransferase n=1 Tax=Roseimaritima ulvae TaxID=980254 RepID=A0A5B9QWI5_9BACT|nr:hypothetical protein [Roseimaritima ulvae]QEG42150.1 hypothetical protein UC8_41840 [Roseimaritima ulvae]